ncbi:MAG: hypothetical protein Q9218_002825 [Villophora microphyllina]
MHEDAQPAVCLWDPQHLLKEANNHLPPNLLILFLIYSLVHVFLPLSVPFHVDLTIQIHVIAKVEKSPSLAGNLIQRSQAVRFAAHPSDFGTGSTIAESVEESCSPHRITIPRQFIIQPPQETSQQANEGMTPGIEVVDLTGDDDDDLPGPESNSDTLDTPQSPPIRIDPALGGGQEVRLCNPCVPDPNPLPHVPFGSPPRRWMIDSFASLGADSPPRTQSNESSDRPVPEPPPRSSSIRHSFHQFGRPSFPTDGSSGDPLSNAPGAESSEPRRPSFPRPSRHLPPNYSTLYGSVPNPSLHDPIDPLTPASVLTMLPLQRYHHLHPQPPLEPLRHHRHHASASATISDHYHHRHRSASDLNARLPPRPHPHTQPRPQLREEDECPICHHALPPKGSDGSETEREEHVRGCIEVHFSGSTPNSNRPHASTATEAAVAVTIPIPAQSSSSGTANAPSNSARRGSQSAAAASSTTPTTDSSPFNRTSSQHRRRVAGMVTYLATEKDCLANDDGEAAECVICFEEFEQGVEMGRLECLCKFHKRCIRQWWDTKGVGACPVHQGGLT